MGKYFGTDGFRGMAGVELTAEHSFKIGRFIGYYFKTKNNRRPKIIIGKDTRLSSYMLEYAMASGITSSGGDAYMLHVTTTPCVSYVVSKDDFDCGIMISASHNVFSDNGIKIVNSSGEKISDEFINEIEEYLDSGISLPYSFGENIGKIIDYSEGRNRYIGYLISLSKYSFKEYKVGLDCANGSAWMIAKSVFEALGTKVYAMGVTPDGVNINNNVGSTDTRALSKYVKDMGLDVGFAFDGDADRCIAIDEDGKIVDGDGIIYLLAKRMKWNDELENDAVVVTVMSNLGLFSALDEINVRYETTQVGDKYVYEKMHECGYCLGGEQSGHVIMTKYATTGDGILTAIKIMEAVISSKLSLSRLLMDFKAYPQIIVNVNVNNKNAVMNDPKLKENIKKISYDLSDIGRVLVRPSGTEPVIRIMIEATSEALCQKYADEIKTLITSLDSSDEVNYDRFS